MDFQLPNADRDTCDVLHWFDPGYVEVDCPHWLPMPPAAAEPAPVSLSEIRRRRAPRIGLADAA